MRHQMIGSRKNILLFIVVFFVSGILSFHQILCDDHWWHIATGRLILKKWAIPEFDVFSFTYYGAPWHNNEWGFSILAALIWDEMGEWGFFLYRWVTLFGVVAFSLLAVNTRASRRGTAEISPWFLLGILFFLFLVLQIRINVRPHMLEYLFVAFTLWQLQRPNDHLFRISSLLWAIPFLAIWFFLHPSWIILPILIAATHADDLLERHHFSFGAWFRARTRRFHLMMFLVASFSLVITVWAFWEGPLSFYRIHFLELDTIFEWRSYRYWFSIHPFYAITLLYYFLVLRSIFNLFRTNPLMSFLIVATGLFSLTALRFISEFVLLSLPFVSTEISRLLSKSAGAVEQKKKMLIVSCAITMGVALLGDTILSNRSWGIGVDRVKNPVLVADFMQRYHLEGNLFASRTTPHSYISFRLWPAVKIFIDGRNTQVYPIRFIREYSQIPFLSLVEQHPIEYRLASSELLDIRRPAEDIIDGRPGFFELIYFNDSWSLSVLSTVLERQPNIKPFRMLYPANLADEDLMRKIRDQGKLPLLLEELAYYGSIAVDPSEKQLYELMRAEIAKYAPVD